MSDDNKNVILKSYLFSILLIVFLNLLILMLFNILRKSFEMPFNVYSIFIYWNIFQIILNSIILYIGFKKIDNFSKRTGYASMIIYGGLFILSLIGIVIFMFTDRGEHGMVLFGEMLIIIPILLYLAIITRLVISYIVKSIISNKLNIIILK